MQRMLLAIAAVIAASALCSAQTIDAKKAGLVGAPKQLLDKHENGNVRSRGMVVMDHDGRYYKDGKWEEFYESGQKAAEGFYRNGQLEGSWTDWYANGRKKAEGSYKGGLREGRWTYWHDNGEIWMEGEYKKGERVGPWT
ncbi:toxin-antitoxin system YwqK family antitoxin, partial [bacterium]|nr:toxin-antitoxin system YwqK family antitoxin [bacterium]